MFAESLKLGCCEVDVTFLKKRSKQLCGACRKVPVDPEITVKVVNGEVTGLVYEWDLQDSWPIHFTKARLQILSFAELEILEVSRNRTLVRMRPEVLQMQTGSQTWDDKVSRRGVSEWHSGAVAETVLPPGFEIEELLVVHELLLKHSLHKAMKQRPFAQRRKGVWQRPMRAMRSSQALVWPHQSSRGDAVFLTADFETG